MTISGACKMCGLLQVACSYITELFISAKAGVIKQTTKRDHP